MSTGRPGALAIRRAHGKIITVVGNDISSYWVEWNRMNLYGLFGVLWSSSTGGPERIWRPDLERNAPAAALTHSRGANDNYRSIRYRPISRHSFFIKDGDRRAKP